MGRGVGMGSGRGRGMGYGSGGTSGRSSTSTVATIGNANVVITVQTSPQEKSIAETYLLCLVLGIVGGHHFFLGRIGFGFLYLFTFGLLGFGVVGDLVRIPCLVVDVNNKLKNPQLADEKSLGDAYVLWFSPFGVLGFHHFYLKNYGLGILYLLTLGVFGIGWLIDAYRIPSMVREVNGIARGDIQPKEKSIYTAYICAISPFGILGLQHYYLQRPLWGLLYTFTWGLLGIGWVCDWFRVPLLVTRYNEGEELVNGVKKSERKYLDDAYILVCPWGIAGLHHFYLRRYFWGLLYLCTFGLMGLGWLIDLFRLPGLVEDYNQLQEENQRIVTAVARDMSSQTTSATVSSGHIPIPTHAGEYPGMVIHPGPQRPVMAPYYPPQIIYPPQQQSWRCESNQERPPQYSLPYQQQQIGAHNAPVEYANIQMQQPPSYDEIMAAEGRTTSGASAAAIKSTIQTTALR